MLYVPQSLWNTTPVTHLEPLLTHLSRFSGAPLVVGGLVSLYHNDSNHRLAWRFIVASPGRINMLAVKTYSGLGSSAASHLDWCQAQQHFAQLRRLSVCGSDSDNLVGLDPLPPFLSVHNSVPVWGELETKMYIFHPLNTSCLLPSASLPEQFRLSCR